MEPTFKIDIYRLRLSRRLNFTVGLASPGITHSQAGTLLLFTKDLPLKKMVYQKTVFVAFAIEDERARDLLKGQSLSTCSPFEYIDMSVKEAYDSNWKDKVRTRIRRSNGIIALISKNSLTSSGQKWEIACAKEEGKKVLGIWAYTYDRTNLPGVATVAWRWDTIKEFINSI